MSTALESRTQASITQKSETTAASKFLDFIVLSLSGSGRYNFSALPRTVRTHVVIEWVFVLVPGTVFAVAFFSPRFLGTSSKCQRKKKQQNCERMKSVFSREIGVPLRPEEAEDEKEEGKNLFFFFLLLFERDLNQETRTCVLSGSLLIFIMIIGYLPARMCLRWRFAINQNFHR